MPGTLTIPYVDLVWSAENTANHDIYGARVELDPRWGRYSWRVTDPDGFGGAGWGRDLEDARRRAERCMSLLVSMDNVGIDNVNDL
jgi:hypothetical protein